MSLVEFISQQQSLAIPQCFIQQFIYNYENRGQWTRSDVLYDNCYATRYARYEIFTKEIRRQLDEADLKLTQPDLVYPKHGGQNKKIWLISTAGVKRLAMVGNKQVRDYYIKLEELCFEFVDHQQKVQHEKLLELEGQIQELKKNDRAASTYQILHGDRLLYIGKDQSQEQNRIQQHLKERKKIISQYQLIDIVLSTHAEQDLTFISTPCGFHDAEVVEKDLIKTLQPECNITHNSKQYVCSKCQKKYSTLGWFERHSC